MDKKRQYLKVGIALLVTIGICSWVAYRLIWPDRTVRYNDFVTDSAVEWLENADDGDFDDCRENSVDKDGWFDWFLKDRKSLDANKSRVLCSKQEMSGASAGMKRYELKFVSKFSKITYPKSRVTERMLVEADGKRQFKVLIADYWLNRAFVPAKRKLTESDREQIMAIAAKVLKRIEARDIEFFKRTYTESAKRPDYFGWNKYILQEIKRINKLFELLDKSKSLPLKFTELKADVPPGRTGFECSNVIYSFPVDVRGRKEHFLLGIFIYRDLYKNKAAKWKFMNLGFWKERKK